jgi:hypothetical protein
MIRGRAFWSLVPPLVLALPSCSFDDASVACGQQAACQPGWVCGSDHLCHPNGQPADVAPADHSFADHALTDVNPGDGIPSDGSRLPDGGDGGNGGDGGRRDGDLRPDVLHPNDGARDGGHREMGVLVDSQPPDTVPPPRYIFIDPIHQSGSFCGITGANALCQSAANGHLPGTYVAILNTVLVPANAVFPTISGRLIVEPDGTPIATDDTFWAMTHANPIQETATGANVAGDMVWTGYDWTGNAPNSCGEYDCTGWNNPCSLGAMGIAGDNSTNWAYSGPPQSCTLQGDLYCIEL